MEPRKDRISETGKRAIRRFAATLPGGLLKRTELRRIISCGRDSFPLVRSVSDESIFRFLLRDGILKEARLSFPSRPETRYSRDEIDIFDLALSASSDSYFCQHTALHLHGLADSEPGLIYVNSEQSEKARGAELTQKSIDQAFRRPARVSNNYAEYEGRKILLLNGKFSGGLGVTELQRGEGRIVRATDLERTLIDVTVRPHYAGGVTGVLDAYKQAGTKLSIPRIVNLLAKLDFVYPYHQAIGFYLDAAGRFSEDELALVHAMTMPFDFYLAHQMKETGYSEPWRVHYPKKVARTG